MRIRQKPGTRKTQTGACLCLPGFHPICLCCSIHFKIMNQLTHTRVLLNALQLVFFSACPINQYDSACSTKCLHGASGTGRLPVKKFALAHQSPSVHWGRFHRKSGALSAVSVRWELHIKLLLLVSLSQLTFSASRAWMVSTAAPFQITASTAKSHISRPEHVCFLQPFYGRYL